MRTHYPPSIRCDADQLKAALQNFLRRLQWHLIHPELPRVGLDRVMNSGGMRIADALHASWRDSEAKLYVEKVFVVKDLLASSPASNQDTELKFALDDLIGVVEDMLICMDLPLIDELHNAGGQGKTGPKKRITLEKAEPLVKKYLISHPDAKRIQVAKAVGCSEGLVQKSNWWRKLVVKRRSEKAPGA